MIGKLGNWESRCRVCGCVHKRGGMPNGSMSLEKGQPKKVGGRRIDDSTSIPSLPVPFSQISLAIQNLPQTLNGAIVLVARGVLGVVLHAYRKQVVVVNDYWQAKTMITLASKTKSLKLRIPVCSSSLGLRVARIVIFCLCLHLKYIT